MTQILNFGLPAQIDVPAPSATIAPPTCTWRRNCAERIAAIQGVADVHLQQEVDAPAFYATIDRARAAQLGLNTSTIATNLNVSLSSSEQVTPNFWTDPKSGNPYYLAVQTPEHDLSSLGDLRNTPVSSATSTADGSVPGLLGNVATLKRDSVPTNANQANIQPVYEVFAGVQGRDLGSVSSQISHIVAEEQKQLAPGNSIQVIGQIQSMNDAFRDLAIGLLFAAVLVYLLMVVNYQNFGDPFVVILALPKATLCGILTMLFITNTTLNVPSLMGAIIGGRRRLGQFDSARDFRARAAARRQDGIRGRDRCRPHPDPAGADDAAAAMIVGMLPMAIGGAGEEQNAALARAVIGGLLFATPTMLLVVPYLFARLRKGNDGRTPHGVFDEAPDELH